MNRSNRCYLTACAALITVLLVGGCAGDFGTSLARSTDQDKARGSESAPAGSIAALMRVADTTRAGGDQATAITLYRRAHALDRLNPEPLAKLGGALNELGAPNEASEAFRGALKIDPANTEAMRGLGAALIALDQPELALEQFEAALAIEEDHRSYAGLGVALDRTGEHAMAQAYYRVGLELAPGNLTLLNNLGLSLALNGEYPVAIETLSQAAGHPAATARYRQNLALAYGLAGMPEAAARIARMDLDEAAVQSNLAYYSLLRAANAGPKGAAAVGAQTEGPPREPAPRGAMGTAIGATDTAAVIAHTDNAGTMGVPAVSAQTEGPLPKPAPSGAFRPGGPGSQLAAPPGLAEFEIIHGSGQPKGVDQPPPPSDEAGGTGPRSALDEAGEVLPDPTPALETGEAAAKPGRPAETVAGGEDRGGRLYARTVALARLPITPSRAAGLTRVLVGARSVSARAELEPAEGWSEPRGGNEASCVRRLPDPPAHGRALPAPPGTAPPPGDDLSSSPDHVISTPDQESSAPARGPSAQAQGSPAPQATLAYQIILYWSGQLVHRTADGISL